MKTPAAAGRHLAALVLSALLSATGASAQVVDSTRTDDELLRELERELAAPTPTQQRSRSGTNPDISVIGDARAWTTSEGERNVDLGVHEVETAFRSTVDPYARADVYLSIASEDGEFEFELEEAYLTTLSLPAGLQLKAGKFRSAFGKINRTHPHALPFIDVPAPYANFLGDEGLNDQGISVNWLVPNPRFYQDVSFEVTRGPAESASFATDDGNRLLYAGRFMNFWDLSPDATLEVGVSAASGPNPSGRTSDLVGLDVTYRWKPLRYNTYRSFLLQAEGLFSRNRTDIGTVDGFGFYALAGYQLGRRWSVFGRFDHADLPDDPDWDEYGISGTLGWYLTEFQKLELGLRHAWARDMDPTWQGLVRLVFVLGTHGAHEY
jgi:hypothetical protein